jgi:nicotinamide-nucleotide amidase
VPSDFEDPGFDDSTSIAAGRRSDAERLIARLAELDWSIAVAESLTGGLLCAEIVAVPGASAHLRGGMVTYATDLKERLLGVDGAILALDGPVQPKVARQMAEGVRAALASGTRHADVGVSTTGIAGPASPDGQPVGTVYVGVSTPLGTRVELLQLDGTREQIRTETVRRALRLVLEAL